MIREHGKQLADQQRQMARSLCVVHPENVDGANCMQVVATLQRLAVANGEKTAEIIEDLCEHLARSKEEQIGLLARLQESNRQMLRLLRQLGKTDAEGPTNG